MCIRDSTNLMLQLAATGTISVGIVLILLLGEIDLSVGSVSGLCASIMVVLNVKHGYGAVTAVLLALLAGAAIGAFHGFVFTRFGVPAFVVTLAGLIGWQGAQLQVCLLYTSDAADDLTRVDLGGRRII